MPRQKTLNPQRLEVDARGDLNWNLGDASSSAGNSELIDVTDEKEDNEKVSKTKTKRSKRKKTGQTDEVLQHYLDMCVFYLEVHRIAYNSETLCKIGQIEITSCQEVVVPKATEAPILYLYIGNEKDQHLLYCEKNLGDCQTEVQYWPMSCDIDFEILNGLQSKKVFAIYLEDWNASSTKLQLSVAVTQNVFHQLKYPSEPAKFGTMYNIVKTLQHFFQLQHEEKSYLEPTVKMWPIHDIECLYSHIRKQQQKNESLAIRSVQHENLIPNLRPYQADAVRWMLSKEEKKEFDCNTLHSLFTELNLESGQTFYCNKFSIVLTKTKPLAIKPTTGGILADEMGLGKTVEVLACILGNPRPSEQLSAQSKVQESSVENCKETEAVANGVCKKSCPENSKQDKSSDSDYRLSDEDDESTGSLTDDSATSGRWSRKFRKRLKTEDDFDYAPSFKRKQKCHNKQADFNGELHCVCGDGTTKTKHRFEDKIQCKKCLGWQHPSCVKFNVKTMSSESYLCPHCWARTDNLIPSKATLVVSPSSIIYQWQEEIDKHVKRGSVNYLVYSGVNREGYVQPVTLADHDIVLTSYETLRKELNYVNLPHSNSNECRKFRNPKRFMAVPSPLTAIEWWRICLDEAQMVECVTTKTAEMALELATINRWCVTGTPIQKSVEDLYGLLCFLGVDPYWVSRWWKELLYNPYCNGNPVPLLGVMKNCFWRTAKKDVLKEMGILEQSEEIHWLTFSPVEEHFYKRQHQKCTQNALEKIHSLKTDLDVKLSALNKHTMTLVLNPLRRLRQASCHPQAVRGHCLPLQKSTMTMEELLQSLTKKTKLECEEAHRQLIACINGLAAIHMIREEFVDAVDKYRDALTSIEDQGQHIKTDRIQQLHTLHNLAQILEGKVTSFENSDEPTSTSDTSFDSGIASESSSASHDNSATSNENFTANSDNNNEINGTFVNECSTTLMPVDITSQENNSMRGSDDLIIMNDEQSTVISQDSSTVRKSKFNPPPGVGRTLRDENLREMESDIRNRYLTKCNDQVMSALEQLAKATQQVDEAKNQFSCSDAKPWWIRTLHYAAQQDDGESLVQRIKVDLLEKQSEGILSLSNRFHGIRGLQLVVHRLLEELNKNHQMLVSSVKKLSHTPTLDDVNQAIDCHLRPIGVSMKCIYCKIHKEFNQYEGRLFHFDEKAATEEPSTSEEALMGQLRRGTWADSQLETILKAISNYAKLKQLSVDIVKDGASHNKLFDLLKKEFRTLRGVWMQIRDLASSLDELEMARIRLRVRLPDEERIDPPVPYILEPEELEPTRLKLMSDRILAQSELRKKLGQLFYLQNLAKADFGKKGGSNPDPCPICQKKLGVQWSVLHCGHGFCIECIRILIVEYSVGFRNNSVRCAVCRQLTAFADISYVNTQLDVTEEDIPVKGSFSTKVEGVVRCLLQIIKEEPESKALVFSTWQYLLEIMGEALMQNDISYVSVFSNNKFQRNLAAFKHEPKINVLLLPVHFGANGLNLIEATHVLLVEPILNPGSEQQAVGRVHRIGQTKATTVHRFIVRNTIEERIYHALRPYYSSMNKLDAEDHSLTLKELAKLFEVQ